MRISDWSSDVCSSDLRGPEQGDVGCAEGNARYKHGQEADLGDDAGQPTLAVARDVIGDREAEQRRNHRHREAEAYGGQRRPAERSEERRVGKEGVSTCKSRGWPYH